MLLNVRTDFVIQPVDAQEPHLLHLTDVFGQGCEYLDLEVRKGVARFRGFLGPCYIGDHSVLRRYDDLSRWT